MAATAPNGYMGLGVSQVQALRLSKLSEILNTLNPMATDADTLMAEGACYQCLGATPGEAVELVLLDLIQENVGGGGEGATNNQSGSGSPVGVATPDYVGQTYTDTDAPYHLWSSVGLTNADWFQIV